MPHRKMRSIIPLLALSVHLVTFSACTQATSSPQVDQAINFLKAACVTSGSSLEIEASGDGGLTIKKLVAGVKGSASLSKKELEGFADAASELGAEQASEMRSCMKPYIDRIIEALLTSQLSGEKKSIVIETTGQPFAVADFDLVMGSAAKRGSGLWSFEDLKEATPIAQAKVEHYIRIAVRNKLGAYHNGGFRLTGDGIAYAISRGLVH